MTTTIYISDTNEEIARRARILANLQHRAFSSVVFDALKEYLTDQRLSKAKSEAYKAITKDR